MKDNIAERLPEVRRHRGTHRRLLCESACSQHLHAKAYSMWYACGMSLEFYKFWSIILWQKDEKEFDQMQDNAKADFPPRLPCLLTSAVGAL